MAKRWGNPDIAVFWQVYIQVLVSCMFFLARYVYTALEVEGEGYRGGMYPEICFRRFFCSVV